MQRMLALATAGALILGATLAHADEISGAIENINLTAKTFKVGDKVFTASPQNTVGATLEELKEGDMVTVFYEESTSGEVSNATSITKK